jgi:hypothetical protein
MRATQLPALGPRTAGEPEPDLTSMVVVHRAIGHDLRRLGAVLAGFATMDEASGPAWPGPAFRRYAASLLAEVRAHIDAEDEFVWPLTAAAAGHAVHLGRLSDDNVAIAVTADRASRALGSPGALAASLGDLREMLDEHVADEERQVFPVMRRYLRAETSRWCERRTTRMAPPGVLRFRLPWLARHARPDELQRLLAAGDWRVPILLRAGRRGYARLEHRAFGPATCQCDYKGLAL